MIETKNLTKKFDSFTAVDSLDLRIETGEFFGLLGPNGAGKTTTISLLSTLLLPTEGEILIDGQTLGRNRPDLKRKISVITQEYSMRQDMNMDEIMEYQGRLYFMPRKEIKRKTEELLDFCGLLPFRKRTVRKLSGGMKRKLMVCRALLTSPEILLLDEPTAGMDALSRRQMWNLLRQLNGKNLTILLTTHYMEEAQSLCNRVALMDHGKLEEINTPSGLIDGLGKYTVDQETPEGAKSHYFHSREEAISFLSSLDGQCTLRETTLEDVFCGARRQASDAAISRRQPQLSYNLTEWTMNYHGNTYYFMGKMGGVPKGFL
ncbi:ABC transporter ATP-binding protein [Ruminococcus sp. SR1/5]|uniref:ABC transporter ATP-binding protein n=2 Tax=Clostridia TaxID=186801 RepID=UPI0001CD615A|nr:ABC transporter ATP-binding protein [Ruminococcus sp. SR1/5]CBL18971.1 ABC-type multidrug transport system, ATPase component [Ruminococcus sp. SR1/5]